MKNFDATVGTQIDPDSYQTPTNWLNARDAAESGANLIALSTTRAKSKDYGWKHYLHCRIEGDPLDVEYTISFTDRSPAYAQLEKLKDDDNERGVMDPDDSAFPFRFRVKQVNKTFGLMAATPEETKLGEQWSPPQREDQTSSPF